MGRKLVSRSELVRLVNERIRQIPDGGNCTLDGVLRLPMPDRDGCNWQEGRIKGIYTDGFRDAVRQIKAAYNLQDDS
jgi:hypothetical protein